MTKKVFFNLSGTPSKSYFSIIIHKLQLQISFDHLKADNLPVFDKLVLKASVSLSHPKSCVILPLTQPQGANQQKNTEVISIKLLLLNVN